MYLPKRCLSLAVVNQDQQHSIAAGNWPTNAEVDAMEPSRNAKLPDETRRRYDHEMETVVSIVYRELAKLDLVQSVSFESWSLADAVEVDTGIESRIDERLSLVIESAVVVQQTYKSIDGERERAIDAFAGMATSVREAFAGNSDAGVNAYLTNVANVGRLVALNEEERLDSSALHGLRAAFDWPTLLGFADVADTIAAHLVQRRPVTLGPRLYAAKRAGPLSHFCWELARPMVAPSDRLSTASALLTDEEGADVAQWMKAQRLTFEEIAVVVDETYLRSHRTDHDLAAAAERVRNRVSKFQESVTAPRTRA
jgi:hypothetical protein